MDPLKEAVSSGVSVNERAATLVDRLVADAAELKIGVARGSLGELLIDAGANHPGSIAAGLRVAEICMGGLGSVALEPSATTPNWPWTLVSRSSNPVIACLASQYAGWRLSHEDGADKFFALGSGPGRALGRREPLFDELGYADKAARATLVLESAGPPPLAGRREGRTRLRRRARRPRFHLCADAEPGRQRADRRARARSRAAQGL